MQQPTMEWNTQKKIWQHLTDNHLFELWGPFSGTWPTSGTMRNGLVYELQMQERLITDSESSSSPTLPTPTVGHLRNHDEDIDGYLQRRQDFTDGLTKGMPGASLGVALRMEMLPTVTTQDAKNNGGPSQLDRNTLPLNTQVLDEVSWGKFEPAIRRWEETLGRPAPAPTKPDGKDDAHRLSSAFTEWMMGLPSGWITDAGLTRNEELKACGNGVVPQQAELALRILLEGVSLEPTQGGGNAPNTNS